jgi:phage terminase small subunit
VGSVIGIDGQEPAAPRTRLPGCPRFVTTKEARKVWRSVVADYELADWQLAMLGEACAALDRAVQARIEIQSRGVTVADRYGVPKANPAVNIERDARVTFARLLRELRLGDDADDLVGDDFRVPRAS